jgi:hypothetical protein
MSDIQEYPKMLYHDGDLTKQRIVNNADEEKALGDEWHDAPDGSVTTVTA